MCAKATLSESSATRTAATGDSDALAQWNPYCRVLPLLNRELARVSAVSAELSIKQPAVA